MSGLAWCSWAAWGSVVAAGWSFRSRAYAAFRAITLGLHSLIVLALFPFVPEGAQPVVLVCHLLVYAESLALIWPRMRPSWYRALVSWPALTFAASTLLAAPWALVAGLGFSPWGLWLPYLAGLVGFVQSVTTRVEEHQVVVGALGGPQRVERIGWGAQEQWRAEPPAAPSFWRSLRLVQITDPHLGPWMSVARLQRICERAVSRGPDLIVLTGDYLTMESQSQARHLSEALRPLRAAPCPVVACLGNHDHEALGTVRAGLESAGALLLVDEECVVNTKAGPVQVLGFDFHFRDRAEQIARLLRRAPRRAGVLRLALLHDPGAFRHLPPGEVDLVLSGHTHGGQVGLLSLGGVQTIVSWLAKMPDHGLWGHGSSRLVVHRGTGHYGFPLRLGVPAEESVLTVLA